MPTMPVRTAGRPAERAAEPPSPGRGAHLMPDPRPVDAPIEADLGGVSAPSDGSDSDRRAALEAEVVRLTAENTRLSDLLARRAGEQAELEAAARRREAQNAREVARLQRSLDGERRAAHEVSMRVRLRRIAGRARRRGGHLLRVLRGGQEPGAGEGRGSAERVRALLSRPPAGLATGPSVSVVVVAPAGSALGELVAALDVTTYRPLELLLVAAPGVDVPPGGVPQQFLDLDPTRSLSEARDAGVRRASGELVLLLDAAAVPARPDWLGCLVESLLRVDLAVVGACAVVRGEAASGPAAPADPARPPVGLLVLGHDVVLVDGMPRGRPVTIGFGPDPTDPADPATASSREIAAAMGVCLLVRRETFMAAGALDGRAPFDQEDVDFCLRVRAAGGRIGVDGRAVVWHPAPVGADAVVASSGGAGRGRPPTHEAGRDAGAARLAATWGPRLYRSVLADRLSGGTTWSSVPVRAVVVAPEVAAAAPLAAGLSALGWTLHAIAPATLDAAALAGADLVLVLAPEVDLRPLGRSAIRIAWIVDPEPWCGTPWLDEYDLLLVPDAGVGARVAAGSAKRPRVTGVGQGDLPEAVAIRREALAWVAASRVAVCTPPPDWTRAHEWGDYPFARDLQRALERRDVPTTVYLRSDWSSLARAREDAAIQLVGLGDPRPLAGQLNVAWLISHPERATEELLAPYDVLFVASDRFAEALRARSGMDAVPLHQATDPERFRPEPGAPVHDLLYVANARPTRRRTIANLVPTEHDLAVYGRGWTADFVDPRYVKGEHVPNRDLHRWYSAARIVLNDHWDEMAAEGFITNRLYDALASGGFVISDEVPGISEEFDGAVVTYRDAADLRLAVERYLADPEARAAHAARGRAAVLARHTFGHRADEILDQVRPRLAARPSRIEALVADTAHSRLLRPREMPAS